MRVCAGRKPQFPKPRSHWTLTPCFRPQAARVLSDWTRVLSILIPRLRLFSPPRAPSAGLAPLWWAHLRDDPVWGGWGHLLRSEPTLSQPCSGSTPPRPHPLLLPDSPHLCVPVCASSAPPCSLGSDARPALPQSERRRAAGDALHEGSAALAERGPRSLPAGSLGAPEPEPAAGRGRPAPPP